MDMDDGCKKFIAQGYTISLTLKRPFLLHLHSSVDKISINAQCQSESFTREIWYERDEGGILGNLGTVQETQ